MTKDVSEDTWFTSAINDVLFMLTHKVFINHIVIIMPKIEFIVIVTFFSMIALFSSNMI